MKEHVKAVHHDTLRAIENAERLIAALGDAEGAGTDKLRKATKRFAKHLKQELATWDEKYRKARGKSGTKREAAAKAAPKGNGKPPRAVAAEVSQHEKPL